MRKLTLVCLFASVVAAVCALFSLGITSGHVSLDDWGYVYGCPFVRGGLTADNLRRAFAEIGYNAFWMPFTYVTYMCDITLFGGGWPVHHAVNVVIHALNALLVVLILHRILVTACGTKDLRAWTLAAVAAFLWAVHPMRAEAVTFVASRKELLWSFFTLAGLLSWAGYLCDGRRSRYGAAILCCLLACMSKPTAVCFPALAYLLEVLHRKSWRPAGLLRYAPFLVVAFVAGCVVLHAQANPLAHERLDPFGESLAWRILNACVGLGMCLWHAVVPTRIHFDYRAVFGGRPLDLELGLSVLAISVLMSGAALYALRRDADRRQALLVAVLWVLVALAPVSGVFGTVNGDHAYADRYTYLPFVGLMAFAVLLAGCCSTRVLLGLAVAAIPVACLELRASAEVIRSFENDGTVFSRVLRIDPDHWRALRVVGNEYCARLGRMDEGVRMLERSLALRPNQRTAESLAYVLAIRGAVGDFDRVRELCAGAAASPSRDHQGMMLDALGTVCLREGRDAEAVRFFRASLTADGRSYSVLHTTLNLALALANSGRPREAVLLLLRLSESNVTGVKACCAQLLERMKMRPTPRFEWNPNPFAVKVQAAFPEQNRYSGSKPDELR